MPRVLAKYQTDGTLSLSDVSWAKARFGHDDESRPVWAEVSAWVVQRKRERTAEIRSELEHKGATASGLKEDCYDDDTCQALVDFEQIAGKFPDWNALHSAALEAWPAVQGFRLAAQTAEHVMTSFQPSLADRLRAAQVSDQIYRIGITGFQFPQRRMPELSAEGTEWFLFALNQDMRKLDRSHTVLLKGLIANGGWPSRSAVTERGQADAWLIVQHSDQDPVFQYDTRTVLKPLVSQEITASNYAYLYDRVNLKLAGHQRYASQLECKDGRLQPQPLEDPAKVDDYRHEAGLPSLADYLKHFPPTCH